MIWNLDVKDALISKPVKILDTHKDVVLSMSFNTDGSLLATACRDRKIRVIDPRAGTVLQVGWVQRFIAHLISPLGSFIAIKGDASVPCSAQGTIWCCSLLLSTNACCHCWKEGFCILIPCSLLLKTLLGLYYCHRYLLQHSEGHHGRECRDQVDRWIQVYICPNGWGCSCCLDFVG